MSLIIVPTDFSPNAERALDQALLMANEGGHQIELLHIVEITRYANIPKVLEAVMTGKKEEEQRLKALLGERIKALGITKPIRQRVKLLYSDDLLNTIVHRFKAAKAKLVVVGSHGISGLGEKLLGSNTTNLIGKAKIPVLVIPPSWSPVHLQKLAVCAMPEQVKQYEKLIGNWSKWFGCGVEALYFTMLPNLAATVKGTFPLQIVPDPVNTPLYQDLVEYSAKFKAEAMVMFIHKRSVFERLFDGSITAKVAGLIKIPLLALPVKEKI